MIAEAEKCPTSGGAAGASKWTAAGHRRGWCPRCGRWVPMTPGGKIKRHAGVVQAVEQVQSGGPTDG